MTSQLVSIVAIQYALSVVYFKLDECGKNWDLNHWCKMTSMHKVLLFRCACKIVHHL